MPVELALAEDRLRRRWPTIYHDRVRPPAETVAVMRRHFPALGITRLARQTDLDCVGISCYAAFRPNSCSISSNQGKGIDDDSARASAIMEAAEYAIAERPTSAVVRRTVDDLHSSGVRFLYPTHWLPIGGEAPPTDREVTWLPGFTLSRGRQEQVLVPADLVSMNGSPRDFPGISQNTNGLASGNTDWEALFHAVCELIERDAATLWTQRSTEAKLSTCIPVRSFCDPVVEDLVARFERAGLVVKLFLQSADVKIPTVFAVTGPRDAAGAMHFDVATGAGAHPSSHRAAVRALTEAAQTRVTSIAASRDDVRPDQYRMPSRSEAAELLGAKEQQLNWSVFGSSNDPEALLKDCLEELDHAGVRDLVAVPLGGENYGISVYRVLSNMLEDRGPNSHWRPGPRALSALLDPPRREVRMTRGRYDEY